MGQSEVFFTDLRTKPGVNLLDKLERLVRLAGIDRLDLKDKFVAVKLHFGEPGNMSYLRPGYVNRIVKILQEQGAKVFLSDSNTLYKGGRSNAVDHIGSALRNGFNPIEVSAPVIIADGVKGTDYVDMPVRGGVRCTGAKIGRAIADADAVISVTHFKGHEQAGFGGTLKNIGMGAASVAGKLFLHSETNPFVIEESCRGCGVCADNCAHGAISIRETVLEGECAGRRSVRKAEIDYGSCVGCGQCVASCLFGAVGYKDSNNTKLLNEKIAEYTKAVVDGKPQMHISLIMDISPECDCWGHNDAAIAPNIGFAASTDPVALDQACADLVIAAPRLGGDNALEDALAGKAGHGREAGCHSHEGEKDIFHIVHPDTDWQSGLAHGEAIGLGSRSYRLIRL